MKVLLIIAVGLLSFANGANDNFKGVATLWGAGLTSYRRAIAWATLGYWLYAPRFADCYLAWKRACGEVQRRKTCRRRGCQATSVSDCHRAWCWCYGASSRETRSAHIHNPFNNRCAPRSRCDCCGILPCEVRCVRQGLHFTSPLLADHRISSDRWHSAIGQSTWMARRKEGLPLCQRTENPCGCGKQLSDVCSCNCPTLRALGTRN